MKRYYSILFFISTSLIFCFDIKQEKDSKIGDTLEKVTSDIKNEKYSELFDVELVGLTINSENTEKYIIDFSSYCMCDSPSILLKQEKAYLFPYCRGNTDSLPPFSKSKFYTYDIIKKEEVNNGISIDLSNDIGKELNLLFIKTDNKIVYKLKIVGEFPHSYIGARVTNYFTFKEDEFEVEDCGDFDG
ncbi:hypothetical protein [Maribacter sp.]|uniref:hypothetical protein n=1 Tax=Maribacter sp. TaxID=1897614 RepID=UPI003297F559